MGTYYAVCNVNGPISVRLDAETLDGAMEEFRTANSRSWIDSAKTEAEDDLGIDGADMSEEVFDDALRAAGATPECDLSEVVNAHAGTVAHLSGGWYLWRKVSKYTYTIFDADPQSSSGTEWPSHHDLEIEADSDADAIEEVESVMSVQAAGLNPSDGYEAGESIHAIVWAEDGAIVGQPSYELTHEDLGTEEDSGVDDADEIRAHESGESGWL